MQRRRRTARLAALLLAPLLAVSAADAGKEPTRSAEEWAAIFESPERFAWQKPVTVMQVLGLGDGDRVADLGAGTGYFTLALALEVAPSGRVTAVDVDRAMLDYIRGRDDVPQEQVTTVLAEPDDPKLAPDSQDLILVVNTWHHIKKRSKYIPKLEAALRPAGRVAIIDFRADAELPVGPPPRERLARGKVLAEFERAGWELVAESVALPYQYFLVLSPPVADVPAFLAADELVE